MKFHSSEYDTSCKLDLDLQNGKVNGSARTGMFNMGETKEGKMQVHNAVSRIASPRADNVFVGQCLSALALYTLR